MPFLLVYSDTARNDIEKLDRVVKKRLGKKIISLQNGPLKVSKKLAGFKEPVYRFRIGDYRVIFEVKGDRIIILRVGHRSTILYANVYHQFVG